MTWKTADGIKEASRFKPQLKTLLKGMLQPATLLDFVRNFIVFEKSKKEDAKTGLIQIQTVKKLAAYHQYYAVNKAVQSTIKVVTARTSSGRKPGAFERIIESGKRWHCVYHHSEVFT